MTVQLNDYKLNFENDKPSYSIEEQLPLFIRKDNQDFVAFLKEYYRFLETKITKITVTSDDANSINSIVEDELLSTAHTLMVDDGVDPDIQITGFEFTPYMEWSDSLVDTPIVDICSVYDSYHQKAVVFYNDLHDDLKSYYIVLSLNGTELVPSEPALFQSGVARKIDAIFDANSNKIIVGYLDDDNESQGNIVDCLIGNNTFTVGTPAVLNSDVTSHIKLVDLPNEKFCAFYDNEGVEIRVRIDIPQIEYTSVGTNTITAKIPILETSVAMEQCIQNFAFDFLVGNDLIIEGAIEDDLNGTWEILGVEKIGEFFFITFAVYEDITAGAYTEDLGTTTLYYNVYRKEMTIGDLDANGIFLAERNVFSDKDYQYISPVYDWENGKLIVSYLNFLDGYGASCIVHLMNYDIRVGREEIFNSGPTFHITSLYVTGGTHVVLYQDADNDNYGTLSVGTIDNGKINYNKHFVFNEEDTQDIKVVWDSNNNKLAVIYNEIDTTSFSVVRTIDILSDEIVAGKKSIFCGFGLSHNDIYYDPIIKKDIIVYGSEDIIEGRISIYNPYQFVFDIVEKGYGIQCNVEILLGEANEGSYGASAIGVLNKDGEVDYILINHGYGYTEAPPIEELIVDDLHNIYLGDGTEDNPIIELSDYKSIDGKIIGYIDVDYNEGGEAYRKDIFIEHYAGALERADMDGEYGEVYNSTILNNLTRNAELPEIIKIEEIETPTYALNSMHNYQDIDYAFNSKLFLGNDLYSIMYKEVMKEWPAELVPSIENLMKAIIGRNIGDFNRSLGTEDAIRFVIKLIYGRDSNVWSAADRLFRLNSGNWYKTNKLVVEIDAESDVLSAEGRLIYNVSKLIVDSAVHDTYNTFSITTTEPHGLKTGSYVTILNDVEYEGTYQITADNDTTFSIEKSYSSVNFRQPLTGIQVSNYYGVIEQVEQSTANTSHASLYITDISGNSFNVDDYIKSTLFTGEIFECKIVEGLVETEAYADNHNLLNGSVLQSLPEKFEIKADQTNTLDQKWDALNPTDATLAGFLSSDIINTDRIQDGDLYQLYSYVIQIQKKAPYILSKYSEEEVKNTIRKLTHPAGFKVTVQEL